MSDHFCRFQTTAHRCHLTAFWLLSQGFSVNDQVWTLEYFAWHRGLHSWNCGGLIPHGVSFDQLEMGSGGYICPSLPHKVDGDKIEFIQLLRGWCSEIRQLVSQVASLIVSTVGSLTFLHHLPVLQLPWSTLPSKLSAQAFASASAFQNTQLRQFLMFDLGGRFQIQFFFFIFTFSQPTPTLFFHQRNQVFQI